MFDTSTYQRQQAGMNMDSGLLVTFRYEAVLKDPPDPTEPYENVPYISIYLGKNDTVDRPATEEDKVRFQDRWESFLKGEETPTSGMPVNKVPFATPAEISACKAERIYTVEQLIATPDVRVQRAHLLKFKYACNDMMESLKNAGHMQEMRDLIESQKKTIDTLLEEVAELKKPKRGRPRKSDGDNTDVSQ